ncbi:MAG: trypsin-like peptidase domain-containing protein [Clostridia bacterium]|nr:trypsin-like peptidase domain-containing protein [Clostridia bacterium]
MSDNFEKKNHSSTEAPPEEQYFYRWNYSDQVAFDRSVEEKQRKSGVLIYTLILTAVFLVCFSILIGLLIWNQGTDHTENTLMGDALTTSQVSELVSPATVLIYSTKMSGYGYGTGFFISDDGYIVTNNHVVEDALAITVRLYSGEELAAVLVGGSAEDDVAVLKVPGYSFPCVMIGDSSLLSVGDKAIAIGNPSGEEGS